MSSSRRALIALAISMAVPVCAAQAATFVVDRTDDSDVSACSTAANDCTLRGAINKANATAGADTINFSLSSDSYIALTELSLPIISGELNIVGPDSAGTSIIAAVMGYSSDPNIGHLFTVPAGSTLRLRYLNLGGGADTADGNRGGIIDNAGATTITNCGIGGNLANGGALYNAGTLTINDSEISSNGQSVKGGPGIRNVANLTVKGCNFEYNRSVGRGAAIENMGSMSVSSSTFEDNEAGGDGGAIFSNGSASITNSTFTDNKFFPPSAGFRGAAIYSANGGLVVESCTISRNSAQNGLSGGIFCESNGTVHNSIVSGNSGDDVVTTVGTPQFRSLGYNLIGTGNAVGRFNATGDQVFVNDPVLSAIDDNGGPSTGTRFVRRTMQPRPGSPAIDRGDTTLTVDQRDAPRPQGAADDIGAHETRGNTPEQPSLIVDTFGAEIDAYDDKITLAEAILYANSKPGADVITFAPNVRGSSSGNVALPTITDDLTIVGPGADQLGYGGIKRVRPFAIAKGVTATISGLSIFEGNDTTNDDRGAGLLNEGNLTLREVKFTGNKGTEGGAIANVGGSLTLIGCEISNNIARNSGAGIFNNNGSVSLINCTISGNLVEGNRVNASGGAGIDSFGPNASVSLDCVTLTGNSAPNVAGNVRAGVWIEEGKFRLHNSIVYGNGARDVQVDSGAIQSSGFNIIGKISTKTGLKSTDKVGVNPKLGALANNGGPTQTHALQTGSPAINLGDPAIRGGFDQRGAGFPRVRGGRADIGAFEVQLDAPATEKPSFIVTTLADVVANDNQTSLREAINYANARAGADTISFAPNVLGTITLSSRLPEITDALTIAGVGARLLTIDGGGKVRLFAVASGVRANIYDLTISGARYDKSQGPEGAIVNRGNLSLVGVALTGNAGIEGGAVTNLGGFVGIKWSQITGNSAVTGGGGLLNNNGTITVNNSTIANNKVTGGTQGGGAISTYGGALTLESVTISGNNAPAVAGNVRAGVWIESGTLTLHNSILYGNGARDLQNDGATVNSQGYNLIGATSGSAGLKSTDVLGVDPKLGAFTDDGATKTLALLAGSPAINAGDPATSGDFEQRGGGFPRVRGGRIDIGAFELQSDANAKTAKPTPTPRAKPAAIAPSGGNS